MLLRNIFFVSLPSIFTATLILIAPGCIKYHQTLPSEFPQGESKTCFNDITNTYVKSTRIYEQFETRAFFDALWLSDKVRVAYSQLYCSKRGTSEEDTEAFIARQLEENNHWIMFYVLADVRDRRGTSLSDKNAPWTFYVKVGDYKATPLSVKEVDLEPEYQGLFGKQWNVFKAAYLVKFPVKTVDVDQKQKIGDSVQLVIESVAKSVTLTWETTDVTTPTKSSKRVKRHEDFYWG